MFGSALASLGISVLAVLCALPASAATEFKDVSVRCAVSAKDPRLASSPATVALDDAAFSLRLEKPQRHVIGVPYAGIVKAVAEVDTAAKTAPGAVAPEKRYWFYFERQPGSYPDRFSFEMGEPGADLLAKIRTLLSGRLQEQAFPLADELTDLSALTDLNINYTVHVVRPAPALPAASKDRALVVAVCPAVEGAKRQPINLDADGRVIAVNEPGTYSYLNLDPGTYTILAQAGNARWIRVKLEAGHVYYFFQDLLDGGERIGLSMHSKEMAQFEISGAALSDWRRLKY
jgi:hypothetical protein